MSEVDNLELTINSVYKQLLQKLTNDQRIRDVSNELLSMQDDSNKVLFVYDLIKSYDLVPLVLKEDKCVNVSIMYRNLGNLYYQGIDLYMALQYYNLALMYSPLEAITYSLAVSNRSAVLIALKQYKACLEDIKLTFTLNYPEKIRDKLLRRKRECEEALTQTVDADFDEDNELADDLLKLKGPKNKRYLSASTKLEVKHTENLGRHVVAKEDIEVGEVIVQEDPYVRVLLKPQFIFTCAYCFSRKLNLYPCPYCALTMYCSRPCVNQAWEEYHQYECPLIASLAKMKFTKLELLALRTTIKARKNKKEWNDVLRMALAADATVNTNEWGHVRDGGKLVYNSKFYPSIHTLATNVEKRDISDIFQKSVTAAVLLHFLGVVNFLKTDNASLRFRIKHFTAATLLRHLMTAPTNMHGITTNIENEAANYVDEYNIGSAAYAFLSLINHSCAPNVVRYCKLGTTQMSLIALRPIKKGMQILDNYGYEEVVREEAQMASKVIARCVPREGSVRAARAAWGRRNKKAHHAVHNKEERQEILKSQYKFTCLCEACVDDWPIYQNLSTVTNLPPAIARKQNELLNGKVVEALQKADRKQALKLFKPLCGLATALEPYIPCKEAAECQEALKQCLAIISGVVEYGYSNFILWNIPAPPLIGEPVISRHYLGTGAEISLS